MSIFLETQHHQCLNHTSFSSDRYYIGVILALCRSESPETRQQAISWIITDSSSSEFAGIYLRVISQKTQVYTTHSEVFENYIFENSVASSREV